MSSKVKSFRIFLLAMVLVFTTVISGSDSVSICRNSRFHAIECFANCF